jgi:erythromycin esterase
MQPTNKLYSLPTLAIHTLLFIFVLAASQPTRLAAQNEFLKANPAIYVSSNPSQPTVNTQWAKFAKTNSIPVQSIDPLNEDYSDLNFLKQEIGNKRIVMLGESTHGADEYSKSKVRLIKFLNKEMGFEVIAFESGMEACAATNYYRTEMTPQEMLKNALFKVWHTEANLELMNYLTIHQQIQIVGFDMQPLKVDTTYSYLQKFFQPIGISLAQNALDAEQKFYKVYRPVNVTTQSDIAALRTQYKDLANNIQQHPDLFNTFHTQQAIQTASQIIKQRIGVLDIAARNSLGVFNPHYRDKFMAENIEWLANELYPNKKNYHLGTQRTHCPTTTSY